MQSGMQEEASGNVNFTAKEAPVVKALLSFMYGMLKTVPDELLLPLFKMADQYQVVTCMPSRIFLHAACGHRVSVKQTVHSSMPGM